MADVLAAGAGGFRGAPGLGLALLGPWLVAVSAVTLAARGWSWRPTAGPLGAACLVREERRRRVPSRP